ncbi:DUF4175 family protein [Paracoccus sp. (in: a-proteobacteria)]|uniref:DUF4175 domain-containing protein n=1 Tax=Paracoccus sp. TaxID=267 RepID=UPI0032209087
MVPPEPFRVRRAVGLTRAGMWWEEIARAFWPAAVVLALAAVALAFGLAEVLPPHAPFWGAVLVLLVAGLAALRGMRRFRLPQERAARSRVDATLPGRPLTALRDRMALGAGDAGADGLWRAHLRRMRAQALAARPVAPDAGLRWRDPLALRLVGLVALAMALVFAPAGRFGAGIAALGAGFRPVLPAATGGPGTPSWEGWAEPPAYTRRPTIYLNGLPEGEVLELPEGTRLSFRLYGEGLALVQDIGAARDDADARAPEIAAERSGVVEIADRRYDIAVLADAAPEVAPGVAPQRRADGRLVQEFTARDDNGIASGEAEIVLDLAAVDRRFGLTVEPELREPLLLELPLPGSGSRKDLRGRLTADLSRHPWANLPVTVALRVEDGIGQQGRATPLHMVLPGRRFFDPLAAALIELRRDLLWSRANAAPSAEVLRAVRWQPEGFMDGELAGGLQGVIARLEAGDLDDPARNKLAQALWDAAVALEDGGLADALARMQQAQERLSEAIRNGASPDEIRRLMDELRAATDAYTDMLAQRQQDPAERFDRSPQDRQQITGDQIRQMMDEIQRLMNEGRMAEAQELLEQFNRMMQNLQVTRSEGGEGSGQRPMNRLAETLREQQKLADEAMRQMQDQYGQWQPETPPGQADGDRQGGDSLAERQRALREDLGRQRGLLPGRGTAEGEEARRQLDEAGRAMEGAEQALREGDPSGAMERQAQAIQSLREGMRALGDMTAENRAPGQQGRSPQAGEQGEGEGPSNSPGGRRGLAQARDRGPQTDPLGRALSGDGSAITSGDPLAEGPDPARKARDLQDEIRRRSGERARPQDERDYLGRLLDRF